MSGKKDKASAEDLHVMDTVEQYESYEDYLDSQVRVGLPLLVFVEWSEGGCCAAVGPSMGLCSSKSRIHYVLIRSRY